MAFSVNTYAQETCEEGQVFDPELEICVDAPAEMPES